MDNLEFIVLTCDKYLNTRVKSIQETWGSNQNIKFLTDSKIEDKDIIGFGTPQTYEGIFEKYLLFFKNYNFTKKDYYFFVDDDTFVNLKNLNKLNLPSKETLFLTGRVLCLNIDGTDLWGNQTGTNISLINGENTSLPLYYQSGGSGFILTQSSCVSIQNYLKSSTNIPYCRFGDVSLGFWARNCGINITPNENFWWDTHEKLLHNNWVPYTTDVNVITYHYVNEELMVEYNNKYNK